MKSIDVIKTCVIDGPSEKVFPYVFKVDLPIIFKKTGLIPAVTGSIQEGIWDKAGKRRTVLFEDGSSAKEELTLVDAPHAFAYRIHSLTSILRHLIDHIEGDWILTETHGSSTSIRWRYALFAKNPAMIPFLSIVITPMIGRMMAKALMILRDGYLHEGESAGRRER